MKRHWQRLAKMEKSIRINGPTSKKVYFDG